MPRINLNHQILMGIGNNTVSIDGLVIGKGGGARWYKDGIVYQDDKDKIIYYNQIDESYTELSRQGANTLAASGNTWAGYLASLNQTRVNEIELFPNKYCYDGSLVASHLLLKDNNQVGNIWDYFTNKLYTIGNINFVRAFDTYFTVSSNSITWIWPYNSTPFQPKQLASGTASVYWKNHYWLLYNYGKYLVFHPSDSLIGYVLASNDSAFNPDAVVGINGKLLCTASLGAAELPNEILKWTEEQILALPLQDLSKLVSAQDNFGNTGAAEPNGTLIQDTTKFVFGQNNKPRTKDHLIEQIEIYPNVFAYTKFGDPKAYEIWARTPFGVEHLEDASGGTDNPNPVKAFLRTEWIPKEIKVGYEYAISIPEHDEIWMERATCKIIAKVPSVRKIWILAYYKNFDCGPDLGKKEVIAVVYDPTGNAHTAGRFIEVNYFALGVGWIWWQSHKSWVVYANPIPVFSSNSLADNKKFYLNSNQHTIPQISGCAVQPSPEPGNLVKPEVTVVNWKPDATVDGWVFEGIDRMNPGFGFKVWTENGSFYASFTNPVGTGRTGATRPYKKCSAIPPNPIPPNPEPIPPGTISQIKVNGLTFRDEQNNIFPYRGFSSFLLLKRFLNGEDIVPYLKLWSGIGYNLARVFSQVDWAGSPGIGFFPKDYPNYDNQLTNFLNLLSQHGLYCELVAHTFDYDLNEMRDHVFRLHEVIKNHKNVFLEIANEPPVNNIDIESLVSLLGNFNPSYPWSTGQYDPLPIKRGTYITPHLDRGDEWPRRFRQLLEYRDGGVYTPEDPAMSIPVVHDEPIGGAEFNQPGRRSNVPSDFYAHGAGCQLHGAGGTFHHESGLNSLPPKGLELDCAVAFAKGLRLVLPSYQLGNYCRAKNPNDDNDNGAGNCPIETDISLRTYGMIIGGLATCVRVRPTGPYTIRAGWKVVSEDSQKVIITLSRI